MAPSGGGQAAGSAPQRPRALFGPDLWPRVAAAAAMGSVALAAAWIGGFLFAAFWWLASIVVLWEWQRLVSGERLAERVAIGGLALVVASSFAQQNLFSFIEAVLGSAVALALGAAAVAWIARPGAKAGRPPASSTLARWLSASDCSGPARTSAGSQFSGCSRSFGEQTSPPISPAG